MKIMEWSKQSQADMTWISGEPELISQKNGYVILINDDDVDLCA